MPKRACECGYIFDLTGDTTENELRLFQQTFIEKTAELLDEGKLCADDFVSSCVAAARHVYSCPECGRLHIETKDRSGVFDAYVNEDERNLRSGPQGPSSG